ncbi:MAG: hypothetical protein VXW15_10475 [Bdellovibrionota bacterium]|nr:hypothetical protein [Bdellovibrionota bacterium]
MSEAKSFRCSKCGCEEFYCNLRKHIIVIVNGSNKFLKEHKEVKRSYTDEEPYGPYECTNCGMLYNELNE